MNSAFGCVCDELINISTFEGIAAGEDKNRGLQIGDIVDQATSFGSSEFGKIAQRLCAGATVNASQVASLRHFPDHDQRALVKVQLSVAAGRLRRQLASPLERLLHSTSTLYHSGFPALSRTK
jgi:hypothetical protein